MILTTVEKENNVFPTVGDLEVGAVLSTSWTFMGGVSHLPASQQFGETHSLNPHESNVTMVTTRV